MSTRTMSHSEKQYYLITNVSSASSSISSPENEIDLHAESWKLPYSIDDKDLTFDGKPLNLLYEENRWQAEHHVQYYGGSHDGNSYSNRSSSEKPRKTSRGRSRQSKK